MFILRKINPSQDCDQLFELIKAHQEYDLFPHQPQFINIDEFKHWVIDRLYDYFHDFYVVENIADVKTKTIHGFVLSYDYRIYDSHCQIYGYLHQGINSTILGQFVDILFKEYPLNKIFLEITDVDNYLLEAANDLGFNQEAILNENRFIVGQYHDLYIMSLYPQNRRNLL